MDGLNVKYRALLQESFVIKRRIKMEKVFISFIKTGVIFNIPESQTCYNFMTVCDRYGRQGIISLSTGRYIAIDDLTKEGLPIIGEVVSLEDTYYEN